jgi:hypothetical protein
VATEADGLRSILAVCILSVFCIVWVWWQASDEGSDLNAKKGS